MGPETAIFVPGNTDHSIANTGGTELRMTFTLAPPGYEKFFRELARTQSDHTPASAAV